ncbi:AAA family ATPase [archaeon]|jgi:predicted kinase|nr:AAA family ATPase [archaeon]MBT6698198.1 AAA family ATPase [archaeon]
MANVSLEKQFMLIINGPSGAGKSTISRKVWSGLSRCVILNLDEIKWMISDYSSTDLETASLVGLDVVSRFLDSGFSVIVEKAFCKKEYVKPFIDLGMEKKVVVKVINIEAPKEVVALRAKKRGVVNKLHDKEIESSKVLRLYDNYIANKFEVDVTYDSSALTVEEISSKIISLILK